MTVESDMRAPSLGARILRHWAVRLLIVFVTLMALYIGTQVGASLTAKTFAKALQPDILLIVFLIAIPINLAAYGLLTRWLENRNPTDLPAAPAAWQLLAGAALGFVMFSALIWLIVAIGHGSIVAPAVLVFPTLALAISLISGVCEELIFRGGLFRIVEQRWGTLAGLLVSSGLFGIAHIFNPNATLVSSLAIMVEAGLLLGLAYTVTRSLWLPIGLHFGWNFTEGGIYTAQVSGGKIPGLLNTTLAGPVNLTGGEFGPEASLLGVALSLIVSLFLLMLTIRRGQWRPFTTRARDPLP